MQLDTRLVGRVGPAVAVAGILLAIAIVYPALTIPLLGILAIVGIAITAPFASLCFCMAWIMLVRPGAELLHVQLGSVQITEVDALAALSVIIGTTLVSRASSKPWKLDKIQLALLFSWPAFACMRALFPTAGTAAFETSPAVDLRLAAAYTLILPAYALLKLKGPIFLANFMLAVALTASCISAIAWIARASGTIGTGEFTLVHVSASAAADIRPGGEISVVFAALILFSMWSLVDRRLRTSLLVMLPLEILLSQTISVMIAIGGGLAFSAILTRQSGHIIVRISALAGVTAVLLLASGILGAGSRFDLTTRVEDSSSSYRISEIEQFMPAVTETPATLVVGPGIGTSFVLESNPWSTEIKRDSHSVLLAVALKTGFVGVILFVAPWLLLVVGGFRSESRTRAGAATCVFGLFVVSLTVPWWWTFNGMVASLVIFAIGSARLQSHPNEPVQAAPIRTKIGHPVGPR